MRLLPFRTALIVAALLMSPIFALAQDEARNGMVRATTPATSTGQSVGPADATKPADRHPRPAAEIFKDLDFFGEVFNRIRAEYVDPPDEQAMIRAAIQGMLTSLDPHSEYFDPARFKASQQDISGQFGGLGLEVTMEQGVIKVVSPIDDSPAQRAGILANDYIVELDGTSTEGLSIDDATTKMRGPIGTKIKLTVVRQGVDKPFYFELTRDTIAEAVVHWSMEGDVPVIRLSHFTDQAFPGLQKAITQINQEYKGGAPKGIVLDLRNNPGGLVDQAVEVAGTWLQSGAIVLIRGRTDADTTRYDAAPNDLNAELAGVPLVTLINGGSASAAEIVAGALQDHKRAPLIGTRSFGKGSVQSIIDLGEWGGIRMTTARYYTPNDRSIQAVGIEPDIDIAEAVPSDLKGQFDTLGEAGLNGQIGGGTASAATTTSSAYVPADKTADTQLQYAIRLIDGQEHNAAYPPKQAG